MSKSQNWIIWIKKAREYGSLKSKKNHTTEYLVDSKGNETSISEYKRMMKRMFKELEEDIQKQLNEFQENID
jgi:hypothetical protein